MTPIKTRCRLSARALGNAGAFAIIIIACVATYYHSLYFGFTNHDDDVMVTNNLAFLKDISNLSKVFVTDAWYGHKWIELYRPLQSLTFMMDAQWMTDIGFVMHTTNLILHTLCCLVIYILLLKLNFRQKVAILGSLIYTSHFFFLHSVVWIPARGDLLLALFAFISVVALISIVNNGKRCCYFLHVISFQLALLSKETAIVLPIIYMSYFMVVDRLAFKVIRKKILGLSYFASFIVYFYLRNIAISGSKKSIGISALIANLPTIPETIAKFLFPINFSTLPSFDASATAAGIIIIIAGLLFFSFKRKYINRMSMFGLCWFLISLIPAMSYRPDFASYTYDYLDHRSYLVCFGLLLLMMSILQQREADLKRHFWVLSLLLVLCLGSTNYCLSLSYKDSYAYAESAVKTNPKSALGFFYYGNEKHKQGQISEALKYYTESLAIYPEFPGSLYNRAYTFYERKLYHEALIDLDKLTKLNSEFSSRAYTLRGAIKATLNDYDGGHHDFIYAIKVDPGNQEAYKNLKMIEELIKSKKRI